MKKFLLLRSKWIVFGFVSLFALLWTLQSTAFKNVLSLDSVETVCLGAQEQWGNLKHPPLSGWIAYCLACWTNCSDFVQYLATQICLVGGMFFIYLTARLYLDTRKSLLAVLLTYFLHYYNPSPMVFCPNPLQMLFLPMVVYVFLQCMRKGSLWLWVLFAIISALAFLSKYSTAIVLLTCLLLMFIKRDWRGKFATVGPWLAGVLFCLLLAPHVHWLWKHDFTCLKYVSDSVNDEKNPWFYFIFILLVGVMPLLIQAAVLFLANFRNLRNIKELPGKFIGNAKAENNREALLVFGLFTAVPILVFVLLALLGFHVVATWLMMFAAWSAPLLILVFPLPLTRKVFLLTFAFLAIYTGAFYIGQGIDLAVRPRVTIHANPKDLTETAKKFYGRFAAGEIPCVIGKRWYANTLEYYMEYHPVSADIHDPRFVGSVIDLANANGALLITPYSDEMVNFYQEHRPDLVGKIREYCNEITLACKTVSGAETEEIYYLGYVPPLTPKEDDAKK